MPAHSLACLSKAIMQFKIRHTNHRHAFNVRVLSMLHNRVSYLSILVLYTLALVITYRYTCRDARVYASSRYGCGCAVWCRARRLDDHPVGVLPHWLAGPTFTICMNQLT